MTTAGKRASAMALRIVELWNAAAIRWPPVADLRLGYAVASPLLPMRFRPTQIEAARITQLVQAAPGPIYRTGDTALNVLPYVPGRILNATLEQLGTVPGPAWMVLPADEAAALLARRPDKLHAVMPLGEVQQWRLLRLDP